MKSWKTYAIIVLALWCAYLTWRTMPYQIWEANEAQQGSDDDVYWVGNRHPPAKPPKHKVQTNVVKRLSGLLRKPIVESDTNPTASKIQ